MLQFPNSFYLSQDDFYFERPDPNNNLAVPDFNNLTTTDQVNNSNSQPEEHYKYIPELESYNFDVIDCIDMKKFHRELNKLIKLNTYDFIFMDGILLYEDVQLCSMLHKSYFIDLDMVTCKKRRAQRNYIIPDTGAYFEKCCWREFQNYKARCDAKYTHLIYIDGTGIFNFVTKSTRFCF
jgi:uridine kinase